MAILFSITTNLSKPMSVPVDCFVFNMKNHWQSSLKNTSSPELENIWSKICETFNHKVENEFSPIWHVLQPPTGSEKNSGTGYLLLDVAGDNRCTDCCPV